jgi:predicted enzyme related to lactoylglutathione lyase
MSRVQLALNVSNLDEAIAFYSKLFGTSRRSSLISSDPGPAS